MNENDHPYVSIIMPVFNEVESVGETISELKKELKK